MTSREYRLDWQASTDTGSVRDHNEDLFAVVPDLKVWVVADGMGGHSAGDWASKQIAESFSELPDCEDLEGLLEAVSNAIHSANATIFQRGVSEGKTMGSTVVSLAISGDAFGIVWAGDSRAYLLRGGELLQLTTDHTQVQAMIARGILPPEEAESHPMSHVLSKAVGVEETLELEGITDKFHSGDLFLLCSDGLHGVLQAGEIRDILLTSEFTASADRLIERCLEVGAKDNVTVIVVQAHERTQLVFGSTAEPQEGAGL
ncbi:MAG: PP2C family protein-serine/threonine phosphatase [Novosphingobium sp.]